MRIPLLRFCGRFAALLALLTFHLPGAQAQTWQLAVAPGGTGNSTLSATAADANGNVYVVGSFAGTITFGSTTLVSVGAFNHDLFVAKWSNSAGRFLWAQQAGGIEEEQALAVAVNGTSVYVAGHFASATVAFGAVSLANTSITSPIRASDGFLAKLTDSGNAGAFDWVQQIGGVGTDGVTGVAVNGANVYVTGFFYGSTVRLGSLTLANAGRNLPDSPDVFVAKLVDTGGNSGFVWAQQGGGTDHDIVSAIAVSGTTIYITGFFFGTAAVFGSTSLVSSGPNGADVFVAKLIDAGSTGRYLWAQRGGGTGHEQASSIAVNGANVYIAGLFERTASVPGRTTVFGSTTLPNAGDLDVFVAKLSDTGGAASFIWAAGAGGSESDTAYGLAVSGANVYVVGGFISTSAAFGSTTLVNAGPPSTPDGFVAKLVDAGPTGRYVWAQRVGSASNDCLVAVATAGTTVYVGGQVALPAAFGGLVITAPRGNAGMAALASIVDSTVVSVPLDDCTAGGASNGCPLVIPNIITPNGDGWNDRFVCRGLAAGKWELAIYNRWGQEVYQRKDYGNEWSAVAQPAGLYHYLLSNPASGQRYRGWVEVVK